MDNPVIASTSQEELSDSLATLASGAPNGDRMQLLVYRVNVNDGREELVRGALISQLTVRNLRALLGIGNDDRVFAYAQSQDAETAGTALGAFGTANGGVPSDVVAPSYSLRRWRVRGPHGEPRRVFWCRLRRCNSTFPRSSNRDDSEGLGSALGEPRAAGARLAVPGHWPLPAPSYNYRKAKKRNFGESISPRPKLHRRSRWPRSVRWVRPLFCYR